jgi:hypothetical protein
MSRTTMIRKAVKMFVGLWHMATIQMFVARLLRSGSALRSVAPYAAIEILLPGGSLLALGLWLVRRQKSRRRLPVSVSTAEGI